MTLPAYVITSFVIEGLLIGFNLSVVAFVIRKILQKIRPYTTAFYALFAAQCLIDLSSYIWVTTIDSVLAEPVLLEHTS